MQQPGMQQMQQQMQQQPGMQPMQQQPGMQQVMQPGQVMQGQAVTYPEVKQMWANLPEFKFKYVMLLQTNFVFS